MADNSVDIRLCQREDVAPMMAFIDAHWQSGHVLSRDERLVRWQFDASRLEVITGTDSAELSVLLAWQKKRIVGMLGLIPCWLNLRGARAPATWFAHWTALAEVRHHGVGLRLISTLREIGFDSNLVLGLNDVVALAYRALRFDLVEEVPRWYAVADAAAAEALVHSAYPDAAAAASAALLAPRAPATVGTEYRIERGPAKFGSRWVRFWQQLAPTQVGTARDSDYMTWRYTEHPRYRYQLWVAYALGASEGIAAAAVTRDEQVFERDERVLRIVELLGADRTARHALAVALATHARAEGFAAADCFCTDLAVGVDLAAAGFQRAARRGYRFPDRFQPLGVGVGPLRGAFWFGPRASAAIGATPGDSAGATAALEGFYVTKSDGDMDRPNIAMAQGC